LPSSLPFPTGKGPSLTEGACDAGGKEKGTLSVVSVGEHAGTVVVVVDVDDDVDKVLVSTVGGSLLQAKPKITDRRTCRAIRHFITPSPLGKIRRPPLDRDYNAWTSFKREFAIVNSLENGVLRRNVRWGRD
jgi:hypothetical protein